jgi:activating signal cointegrator complex subunit 2
VKMGAKLLVDRQLAFMPFFPSDNPGVASRDVTQTAEVLNLADEGLEVLLAAPLHRFWSQLAHDSSVQVFLDSFLRYRRRAFDEHLDAASHALGSTEAAVRVNEVAVHRVEEKLLQVLLRMSSTEGFGSQLEPDSERLSHGAHASLLYDTWLIDVPKLLDVCAVYSGVDLFLTQKMVRNIFAAQPKYLDDLNQTLPLVCGALDASAQRLLALSRDEALICADAAKDTCVYLSDCALTLLALLRAYPEAAAVCWRHALLHTLAAAHCRIAAATRRGTVLHNNGLIAPGVHKRLRASALDCSQALILAMMQGPRGSGGGGRGRGGGSGGAQYEGRPVTEVVASEVVAIDGWGGGGNGVDGWVFLRDLEFRHALSSRLGVCGGDSGGGGVEADGVVQEAIEALKNSLSCKKKRARAATGMEKAGAREAGAPLALDMQKVGQVRDILGDSFGEGFVAAMLKDMDFSVERVIQALLEENIPPSLASMDRSALLQLQVQERPAAGGAAVGGVGVRAGAARSRHMSERANIFEGDEFDVLHSDKMRLEGVHIKDRTDARRQIQGLGDEEAQEIKESTARLVKMQQVDEVRETLKAAQAELHAGDLSAKVRIARAQDKLDSLVAALDEGGGWAEGDEAYDDEYDDAFDGLGFLSMSEGQTTEETAVVTGHAAKRRERRKAAQAPAESSADSSVAAQEDDEMDAGMVEDEFDDDDEYDPERGVGWGGGAPGRGRWSAGGGLGAAAGDEGSMGRGLAPPFGRGRGDQGRVDGLDRGGGRGGGVGGIGGVSGVGGREEKIARPARGRGWGTANAKIARRKEENKSAIGNHHRKDRAARKMRMSAGV